MVAQSASATQGAKWNRGAVAPPPDLCQRSVGQSVQGVDDPHDPKPETAAVTRSEVIQVLHKDQRVR